MQNNKIFNIGIQENVSPFVVIFDLVVGHCMFEGPPNLGPMLLGYPKNTDPIVEPKWDFQISAQFPSDPIKGISNQQFRITYPAINLEQELRMITVAIIRLYHSLPRIQRKIDCQFIYHFNCIKCTEDYCSHSSVCVYAANCPLAREIGSSCRENMHYLSD